MKNREFYPWRDMMSRIECIVTGPLPVYESLNWDRLLEFIIYRDIDMGLIRFKFHGQKLQAIIEKKPSRYNLVCNLYILCLPRN